jgi:glucose uptake protein GlcU
MCFITSWLVLAFGVPFTFTPWGFVSGLFMVPGGSAGFFAVRNAGLAASQGIWSSLKVLVAFGWGIFIFHEPVRSKVGTGLAVAFMMAGLAGMSYFAAPSRNQANESDDGVEDTFALPSREPLLRFCVWWSKASSSVKLRDASEPMKEVVQEEELVTSLIQEFRMQRETEAGETAVQNDIEIEATPRDELPPVLKHKLRKVDPSLGGLPLSISGSGLNQRKIALFGSLNRGQLGVLGAVIDGAYGGSILVPMHYARSTDTQGLAYVLSFAIGCATVVSVVWILRFLFYCQRTQSFSEGFQSLPSFHIMTIGPYAVLSGLIWSIGNVTSILSVAILGQGVGYSIVQSQLLVAGLWGVFYYREIRGLRVVTSWFLCACVTVVGILLLSQEHVSEIA